MFCNIGASEANWLRGDPTRQGHKNGALVCNEVHVGTQDWPADIFLENGVTGEPIAAYVTVTRTP